MLDSPFESLESALRFVALLMETAEDAQRQIREDIVAANTPERARELEALRLVDHKLNQLNVHLRAASRTLNDLRMLRRVLTSGQD
jgi:hypothetical protein